MRLLLALSVVLIALAVLPEPSSAQTQDAPSVKDRLKSIGETIKTAATNFGEKTKTAFEDLHNSEFATSTRNFFSEKFQNIKNKFSK
ncbi:apolipoprotein C-I [Anomaloglossus baeobatrachus]|uniref:apolipoprotein C-I n=1 Tax=Anomaloglossus baeobatrachus TaxID=238106 RepID=UPI003F4FEDE1